MKINFLLSNNLDSLAFEPGTVTVFELIMDNHSGFDGSGFVFMEIGAFPFLLGDDLFGFVIDIVDGSFQGFAVLEIECTEHADGAEVVLINDKLLEPAEREFGFADCSGFRVEDVVVLNDIKLFIFVVLFILVADTDQHEAVFGGFPHSVHGTLKISNTIWNTDFVLNFVDIELALRIISNVISLKVPELIMTGLEPAHHRVLIGLLGNVLVCPFVLF